MKNKLKALLLVMAMVMAACSGGGTTDETTSDTSPPATDTETTQASSDTTATEPDTTATEDTPVELITGPGVTEDTITLGALLDLSFIFGGQGRTMVATDEIFWGTVNANGGVCGRQVETVVRDHAYDPQQAVAAYQEIQPDILALSLVLGSPVQAALLPLITEDEVAMGEVGWSSAFSENPYTVISGASYDIQMILGLQYLLDQGLIAEGDTVGHIYFVGAFGENSLRGSSFAAEQLGIELVDIQITPQVQDLTTQVTQLQREGATAILLSAASPQLASVVNAQRALDYAVPIMGQIPTFVPSLLDEPAIAEHLAQYYYMSTPIAPLGADKPEVQEVADQFAAAGGDAAADINVVFTWAQDSMFQLALEAACEAGDLSRPSFVEQLTSLEGIETGITTPLSYVPGQPSGTQVYIARTNSDLVGGLEIAAEGVSSPLLEQYELPSGG